MLFKDLIKIKEDFNPVFILGKEEDEKHWKDFIPHTDFLKLLEKILRALEDPKRKYTSLWLQGSYGVGKTHACSVISHLLHDDWEAIKDYVEKRIEKPQITQKLKRFREERRYLPVFLKGTESAPNLEFMNIYVKKAIEDKLLQIGVEPPIYEINNLLDLIEKEDEEKLLEKIVDYDSKEKLLEELREGKSTALNACYNYVREKGWYQEVDLKKWLKEVNTRIRERGYTGIILIWDEFTEVLDQGPKYLGKIQNILAENPEVFLIIVTHRFSDYYKRYYDEETFRKIQDRFIHHRLELLENITFYILKNTIIRKEKWKEYAEKFTSRLPLDSFLKLLNVDKVKKEDLKALYPIHPYTVILGNYISRTMFSATRSLFSFLFGPEGALKLFENKTVEEEPFLTVDYLWDYFEKELWERDYGDKARDVINHYSNNKEKLSGSHLKVYKTLLVLNLIYKQSQEVREFTKPSENNVKLAYSGVYEEREIEKILEDIDKKGILRKNPEGIFLVLSTSLPENELKDEEAKLRAAFPSVYEILKTVDNIDSHLNLSANVFRNIYLLVSSGRDGVERKVKEDNNLYVILGFPTNPKEKEELKESFRELSLKVPNAVFVLWETEFGDYSLSEWISWKARENVADRHNLAQEKEYASKMAKNIVDKYLKGETVLSLYFRGNEERINKQSLATRLNEKSAEIFSKGPEKLGVKNINLWRQGGKNLAQKILTAEKYAEIETHLSKGPEKELKTPLLQDKNYTRVLTENLTINPSAQEDHPVVQLARELEKVFRSKKRVKPQDMEFLKKPPFGLDDKKVSVSMLAVALKTLQPNLYRVGSGKASGTELYNFLEDIFRNKPKYYVELRLGSETEEKLTRHFKELFEDIISFTEEDNSLIRVRNAIRDFLNKQALPLWFLAHSNQVREREDLKQAVRKISQFIMEPVETLSDKELKEILTILENMKLQLKTIITVNNLIEGRSNFILRRIGSRDINPKDVTNDLVRETPTSQLWEEEIVSQKLDEIIEKHEKKKMEVTKKKTIIASEKEQQSQVSASQPLLSQERDPYNGEVKEDIYELINKADIQMLRLAFKRLLEKYPFLEEEVRRCLSG